ncbi:MAG: type II secretion system protein GspG [Acidobacteriota bacterium]
MRSRRGFSLTELLIVMGVIAALSAMAIPNLISAVQRGRQKRTVGELRAISSALGAYVTDNDNYPIETTPIPVSQLDTVLTPTFINHLNGVDGWYRELTYESDGTDYTLTSLGRDGVSSGPATGAITSFDHDILMSTGSFVTWPDGVQN